jgi:hypothetical protein
MRTDAAPARRVAWHLRRIRKDLGYTYGQAASCLGVSRFRLWRWEHGSGLTEEQIDAAARAYGMEREALLPAREPVRVDLDTRVMQVGDVEIRLQSDAGDEVMAAYLRVIRTVRGLRAGALMALRDDDLAILTDVLGREPEEIEARLVELMGLSRQEAAELRRMLVKRRVLAPAAGIFMGASLLAAPVAQPQASDPDLADSGPQVASLSELVEEAALDAPDPGSRDKQDDEQEAVSTPVAQSAGTLSSVTERSSPSSQAGAADTGADDAAAVEVVEEMEVLPDAPDPLLLKDAWPAPSATLEGGPAVELEDAPTDGDSPAPVPQDLALIDDAPKESPAVDSPLVVDDDPVDEDPVDEDPVDDDPVEGDPVDEDPVDEDPVEGDPVDEDPVDEDPVEGDPVDEDPVDEDPVDEDPVDEDPVDEDPIDEEPPGGGPPGGGPPGGGPPGGGPPGGGPPGGGGGGGGG